MDQVGLNILVKLFFKKEVFRTLPAECKSLFLCSFVSSDLQVKNPTVWAPPARRLEFCALLIEGKAEGKNRYIRDIKGLYGIDRKMCQFIILNN